ncbi:MAG: hypothetical protein J4F39_08030 [Candidatus Latescibacteria bacterium]|nr:hypothetical protein [Candidatus Latescibacterota bacterium]
MEARQSRFLISGVLIGVCAIGILALGETRYRMPLFFVLFGLWMVFYVAAVLHCSCASLKTVVLFGLLFRVILLFSAPGLSDDVYRYLWDGRVQAAGINPYVYPPASEALADLKDDVVFPRVNHPHVPTIYPPLAQIFFRVCYLIHPSVWAIKTGLVLFDLLTAWFLLGLIRLYDQHPGQLLIYLWHPLLPVEVAGNGHVDALGVSFMVIAFLYLQVGGYARAFAALGLSFLGKFFAICLVPVFFRWICGRISQSSEGRLRAGFSPKAIWPVLIFTATIAAGYLPYREAGDTLFAGFLTYAEHWSFNAPVYDILSYALDNPLWARAAIAVGFGTAVILFTFSRMPPIQAGFFLVGAFLLLTPTLHPWYAIWMIPFMVFYRQPAWLVFTGLIAVSYHVLIRYASEGVWEEAVWVTPLLFGGFALVWAFEWIRQRRTET